MTRWFVLVALVLLPFALPARAERPPVTAYALDWDDNIFNMPTVTVLWNRLTHAQRTITTAEFALVRQKIGTSGEWKDFELRADPRTGSLRFFGDESERGKIFAKDVITALETPGRVWKGPSWEPFVKALSRPETAKRTALITARLHSPHSIWEGLRELQRRGFLRYLPPEPAEDPAKLDRSSLCIFPVAYPRMIPEFRGTAADPSAAKARVMEELLDRLSREPIAPDAKPVTDREGKGLCRLHLWGFSDDDHGNFQKAQDVLSAGVRQGRWGKVKIVLFFTGRNHPTQKPHAVVLTATGPRDLLPEERREHRALSTGLPRAR